MYQKMTCGGGMTKTELWRNSNPANTFDAQSITLSESMRNFEYIEVYYKTYTNMEVYSSVITKVSDFIETAYAGGKTLQVLGEVTIFSWGLEAIFRAYYYKSDTSIQFNKAITSGGSQNIYADIPCIVYGLK